MNFLSEYKGLPLAYKDDDSMIFIKLDSSNKVFSIAFKSTAELESQFEKLKTFVIDKNLDDLCRNFIKMAFRAYDSEDFIFQQALYKLREAFYLLKGEGFAPFLDKDHIVCRCEAIDRKVLRNLFEFHKGDYKQAILESGVGLKCSKCRPLSLELWSELENKSGNEDHFLEFIKDGINHFFQYTHLDLRPEELELIEVSKGTLSFRYLGNTYYRDLKSIENSLYNYFLGELNLKVSLRITFR